MEQSKIVEKQRTIVEWEEITRELKHQLDSKQQDLILAAEIGQSLVEENNSLKAKLNSNDTLEYIQELETNQLQLQTQIEALQQQMHSIQDSEKNALVLVKEMETSQSQVNASYKQCQLDFQEFKEKWKSLKFDYETLHEKHVESLSNTQIPAQNKLIKELSGKLNGLESELRDSNALNKELETNCQELIRLNQEYMEYRNQSLEQQVLIQDLHSSLSKAQESLIQSQNKLSKYEQGSQVTQEAPKTLLSEVEEKRILAEQQHSILEQKHQGLLKNTVIQQERMRNHISRLTQLSQNQSAEHRVLVLEQELSQALSDNQELEARLLQMEKSSRRSSFRNNEDSPLDSVEYCRRSHGDADESTMENMNYRVNQLIQENDKLSMELKTLHLIKLNEADKVRLAYALLHERETELDQTRCQLAQARFDLDELKLLQDEPSTVSSTVFTTDPTAVDNAEFNVNKKQELDSILEITDLNSHSNSHSDVDLDVELDIDSVINSLDKNSQHSEIIQIIDKDESSLKSSDVDSAVNEIIKEKENQELQLAIDATHLSTSPLTSPPNPCINPQSPLLKRKSPLINNKKSKPKMIKIQKAASSNECNQQ